MKQQITGSKPVQMSRKYLCS